jgi:hypothetical protein
MRVGDAATAENILQDSLFRALNGIGICAAENRLCPGFSGFCGTQSRIIIVKF